MNPPYRNKGITLCGSGERHIWGGGRETHSKMALSLIKPLKCLPLYFNLANVELIDYSGILKKLHITNRLLRVTKNGKCPHVKAHTCVWAFGMSMCICMAVGAA